jgi:hypothetical protein
MYCIMIEISFGSAKSDESGNTNLGVTKSMVIQCRKANIVYGFLRKKEK